MRSAILPALTVAVLAATPAAVRAQDVFDAKAAGHVRDRYLANMDTLHSRFVSLANAIPADKYGWRPSPDVRTISEVFVHVATEWYFWDPKGIGGTSLPELGSGKEAQTKIADMEKKITSKADVIAELHKAFGYGRNQIANANPATLTGPIKPWNLTVDEMAIEMTADLHEHLGQLIAYARSVGVKPPWTK